MPDGTRARTVVLGAGFAGTLAARACARAGHDVTVVEKDSELSLPRPGVAHAGQLHNLLGRAQRHLIDLVPGMVAGFDAAGGCRASVAADTRVFELGRPMPARDVGLEIWSAPRHVIDSVAQAGLEDLATLALGRRFESLIVTDGRVVGVELDGERLESDLVIDAMGARSPVSRLLGPRAPEILEHPVRQWYTTLTAELPDATNGIFWLTFATAPRTRGGLASPQGSGLWTVSLSGGPADVPPTTVDEFTAYADTLEDPELARLLRAGRATSAPRTFRKPVARWRRYDRVADPAVGLLSIGDAVADLNPLFGQGLSVAAWQAAELDELLGTTTDIGELGRQYAQRAAAAVRAAWELMVIFEDDAAAPLLPEAWDRLAALVEADPAAHRRYVEVWHLLSPVDSLAELTRSDGVGVPL